MNININLQYLRGQWSKEINALRGANAQTLQFVESEITALLEKLAPVHQQNTVQAAPAAPVAPVTEVPAPVVEAPAPVVVETPVVEAAAPVVEETPVVETPAAVVEQAPVVEEKTFASRKKQNN
jgi:hypothetical protein